jgi:polyhydroxyalkanoate synthase subunit PhaC
MEPFRIPPERALAEMLEFGRKLGGGIEALGRTGEIVVGATPREAVYGEDKLTLYHYPPLGPPLGLPPVVICYALVNRPYMMDLQPDRSLIRGLSLAGLDVYLIDWGYPDGADRFLELDDYVNGYLARCIGHVKAARSVAQVNLLGVCQGGTMSLCYAALHPADIANLVLMVTPVDFQTPDNLLSKWARAMDVDRMVAAYGNIPGELLNLTFLSLMPFRLTSQKYAGLADMLDDPVQLASFLRMEKWIFDSPDQAGEAFRQFVKWCFQENRLIEGRLELGGRRVDLSRISMPVFNVYATQDHLVPPAASLALGGRVGTKDYSTLAFEGGHIGIYVSGRAQKVLPTAIADWLRTRA